MKKILIYVAVATASLLMSAGRAGATPFNFTDLNGGVEGRLTGPQVDDGVIATAWVKTLGTYVQSYLYLRNDDEDHGLGVCSESLTDCQTKGGDVNELSNQSKPELIRLELPANKVWSSLWVSSLDSGGSNGHEQGILSWGSVADPNGARSGSFNFGFGNFGTQVEGDLLTLSIAGFQANAKYLFLTPNSANGSNNDYLVWKGAIDNDRQLQAVPEPSSLLLIATGLLGAARRRKLAR